MNRKFSTATIIALLLVSGMALARPAAAATDPAIDPIPGTTMKLLGHVVWEGRPDQPDALQQLPITVHLQQLEKAPSVGIDLDAITDEKGYMVLDVSELPAGLYEWRAKGAQYLTNSGQVKLGQFEVTSVEIGLMRAGDVNDDNRVNISDFNLLTGSFGKTIKDPGFVAAADFTGDDAITIRDYTLLASHFGQAGD